MVADQYAAEEPGESRGSCTWGAKQTGELKKKKTTLKEIQLEIFLSHHNTCSRKHVHSEWNAMVWFVFCFVFTCRMSKMSCRCVLTAVLGVITLTFREQNNNVKQTLAYRDTRSNLAFIYVGGGGGEKKKKKHNFKVLLREKLCVNRTSHRSILRNASWSYVTHNQKGLILTPRILADLRCV